LLPNPAGCKAEALEEPEGLDAAVGNPVGNPVGSPVGNPAEGSGLAPLGPSFAGVGGA